MFLIQYIHRYLKKGVILLTFFIVALWAPFNFYFWLGERTCQVELCYIVVSKTPHTLQIGIKFPPSIYISLCLHMCVFVPLTNGRILFQKLRGEFCYLNYGINFFFLSFFLESIRNHTSPHMFFKKDILGLEFLSPYHSHR